MLRLGRSPKRVCQVVDSDLVEIARVVSNREWPIRELQELLREDHRLTHCLTQIPALVLHGPLGEVIELRVSNSRRDDASHLVELQGASHGEYL